MAEGVNIGNINIPAIVGSTGPTGMAGKIKEIRIKPLTPLEKATVSNLGTETEAIIEIGIPQNDNITSAKIDEKGKLIFQFESGNSLDVGNVVGTGIKDIILKEGHLSFLLTDETTRDAGNVYDDALINSQLSSIENVVDNKTKYLNGLISEIEDANDTAITTIEEAKSTALSSISSTEDTALGNIENKETSSIEAINDKTTEKIEEIDNNTTSKITEFNSNATNKTTAFNSNATSKTTTFNNNVTSKTNAFDENSTNKLNSFNTNVTEKLEDFNTNYETKLEEINSDLNTQRITNLEEENEYQNKVINGLLGDKKSEVVEGDNITINDCVEVPIKDFKICGKEIKQETREGYNQVDKIQIIANQNIDTVGEEIITTLPLTSANTINVSIDINNINVKQGDYYISCDIRLKSGSCQKVNTLQATGDINLSSIASTEIISFPNITNEFQRYIRKYTIAENVTENEKISRFNVQLLNCENAVFEIKNIQISRGNKPYEKFGAMPSKDFPSPLKYVKGNQEIQQYSNLYNNKKDILGKIVNLNSLKLQDNNLWNTSDLIEVISNTDICFSYDISSKSQLQISQYTEDDVETATISNMGDFRANADNKLVVRLNDDTKYIRVGYRNDLYHSNLMLNYGTERMEYTEYQKSKIYELTNMPDLYSENDYIYYDEEQEKYYVYNTMKKHIFNGTETWSKSNSQPIDENWSSFYPNNVVFNKYNGGNRKEDVCFSNYYKNTNNSTSSNSTLINNATSNIIVSNSSTVGQIMFVSQNSTVEEMKTECKELYDSGKPLELVYTSKEATETEITDTVLIEELDKLRKMFMYSGTNHFIASAENGQAANLEVTVYKDTFKLMQSKIDELETKIDALIIDNA